VVVAEVAEVAAADLVVAAAEEAEAKVDTEEAADCCSG
jgi:hypothetical protein